MRLLILLFLLTGIGACSTTRTVRPLVTSSSGLQYRDLVLGWGPVAESGQTLTVHYTARFESGEEFDRSAERGPLTFTLGIGQVIKGWDEGIPGMRVGGARRLIIPPDLAYGSDGIPGFMPPNATLEFDVVLLEVR